MNPVPIRNQAVDAYRGFVMLLMMAEVLSLPKVAQAFPDSWLWQTLAYHQSHVEWAGCSLHDMIQPSFSFLVGVALPYSIASRMAKGATLGPLFGHACWRAFVLIAMGIFLRSTHSPQTNFTFEDTLTQIGLGYPFLFLLGFRPPRWQWVALGVILAGYWLVWALYPVAPELGFAGHWMKADNYGAAFDRWFMNLFPRATPYLANRGGYLTLSFIPTLGTMILGLAAGRWLRDSAPELPLKKFLVAGVAAVAAGLLLHFAGVCPIVKRIWTPSWTLFSGGLCFLFLAGFSWVIDVKGHRRWAFPLVVIGMNSIAAYLIAHLWDGFLIDSFRIHLGADFFSFTGPAMAPFWRGAAVLAVFYWVLLWMYRRKLFLKV
jgi:heparan-alpha-glucosaminide N-acetyltransferase